MHLHSLHPRRWALGFAASVFVLILFGSVQAERGVPESRLARLTRGVNISHWFWLHESADRIAHWQTYIGATDLDALAAWGIRHVRIPVDVKYLFDWEQPDRLNAETLRYLDAAIRGFLERDMAVIVCPFGDLQEKVSQPGYLDRAVAFWGEFAAHLRHFDPEYVFLQPANEPSDTPANWQIQQAALIAAIRRNAPEHTIISANTTKFGPGAEDWGGITALTMTQPYDDPNIVYGFHFYEPFMFTHQGAKWGGWVGLLSGVPYPANERGVRGLQERLRREITDPALAWVPNMIPAYVRAGWNKDKLAETLRPAFAWAERHRVRLIVDEFGVYRYGGAPPKDRNRWLEDARQIFEREGVGWTMWDYAGGFALALDDPNRPGQRQIDEETAKALGLRRR